MRGRLSHAQHELVLAVRAYQRRYGPGPTLAYAIRYMEKGTLLEQLLPRLLADGWIAFSRTPVSEAGRLVVRR